MQLQPQRDKVVVTLLPSEESTGLIVRTQTETPIRRVMVEVVGPDAHDIVVGRVYLANILSGQIVGDDQMVLPSKPGQSAFLAVEE